VWHIPLDSRGRQQPLNRATRSQTKNQRSVRIFMFLSKPA
jgi:hypothetical protein